MELKGKKVLSFIHSDFEDLEFWYPVLRLREEGIEVDVAGENADETYKGKYGVLAKSNLNFEQVKPKEYDGLLVPGGWAPDKLRRFPEVIDIVKKFNIEKKPIGHICHGGWVLISADIVKGKTVTSTVAIKDDLQNAGAKWVDKDVVVDENIVSSRKPMDLPVYMKEYINILK